MLIQIVVIVALAIVLFLCLFLGFTQGLRLGMNTANGKTPKSIVQGITFAKESILPKADPIAEGFKNMMNYTGNEVTEDAD